MLVWLTLGRAALLTLTKPCDFNRTDFRIRHRRTAVAVVSRNRNTKRLSARYGFAVSRYRRLAKGCHHAVQRPKNPTPYPAPLPASPAWVGAIMIPSPRPTGSSPTPSNSGL